jgi:hypothetical protein
MAMSSGADAASLPAEGRLNAAVGSLEAACHREARRKRRSHAVGARMMLTSENHPTRYGF